MSDSRSWEYVARHGDGVWELDALDPDVLDAIASDAIERLLPDDWDDQLAEERRIQERIRELGRTI